MMNADGPVRCPSCKPHKNKKGKIIGPNLTLSESNYSGYGVDMANCPECGKGFQISFKIDKIERAPSWDVDLVAEEEANKEYRKKNIERLEEELRKAKESVL